MTIDDIKLLAKAGFTAAQIGALASVKTPAPAPAAEPPKPTEPVDETAKLIAALQANNLIQAEQPKTETVDDILASIINPPELK